MATDSDTKKQRRDLGAVSKADVLAMLQSACSYGVSAGLAVRSRTDATEDGPALVIVIYGAQQAQGDDGLTRFELIGQSGDLATS